ncbi:hypothetical protein [Methanolapillus millepedarum]|uniref:hypothetical protein n=1 Tax=Methanolapillus millepedarum TaxID=3028296 RepID=UPI0030B91040
MKRPEATVFSGSRRRKPESESNCIMGTEGANRNRKQLYYLETDDANRNKKQLYYLETDDANRNRKQLYCWKQMMQIGTASNCIVGIR